MTRTFKHLDCGNIRYVFRKGFAVEIVWRDVEQKWFVYPLDDHLPEQPGLGDTIREALSDYAELFDLLYLECVSGRHDGTTAGKRLVKHVKHLVSRTEKILPRLC